MGQDQCRKAGSRVDIQMSGETSYGDSEDGLEARFCSFFSGTDAKASKKSNIEENIVWSHLIHHLDEAKVDSSDIALIVSADYCASFLRDGNPMYHALNSGRESLLEHLAGNLSEFNLFINKITVVTPGRTGSDKTFGLAMLYQTYLSLFKHKKLAQMINDADDIEDLRGIVFLDVLYSMSGDLLDGIVRSDMTIRRKTIDALGKYASLIERTKEKTKERTKEKTDADDTGYTEPDDDPDETPYRIRHPRPSRSAPDNFLKEIVGAGIGIAIAASVGLFGFFHSSGNSENTPAVEVQYKEELVYIVKKKDTLREIAGRVTGNRDNYGLIAEYNDINNPNHIDVDQAIAIPKNLAVESNQLYKISFPPQGSLGRCYNAVEWERFEDIVDYVTGSRHNSGIIFEYNRWIDPKFDAKIEKGEKIYFPQELIKEKRAPSP